MSRDGMESKKSKLHRGKFRAKITGIVHCPVCGEMLWPPEATGTVVDESGHQYESVLDADPAEVLYHEDCYRESEPSPNDYTAKPD